MKKGRLSLSLVNILGSVIPLVFVVLLLSLSCIDLTNQLLKDKITENSSSTMEYINSSITKDLIPVRVKLEDFALIASTESNPEILDKVLRGVAQNAGCCSTFYYATKEECFSGLTGGYYLDSSDWIPDEGWIPQQRDWYKAAVAQGGKLAVTDPYVDSMTNELCVTFAQAVYTPGKELKGVVSGDLILSDLCSVVDDAHASENDQIYLLSADGVYLTNSDISKVTVANYFDDSDISNMGYNAKTYLDGKEKQYMKDGKYYAVCQLDNLPWFIVIEGPVADFSGYYQKKVVAVFAVILLVLIVSVVLILFYTKNTSRNFKNLANSCTKLAEGDFTEEFKSYPIREANELSSGFQNFSNGMKDLVFNVTKATNVVSNSSNELTSTADNISHSVLSAEKSIEGMNASVQSQIKAMDTVYENVNEIVQKTNMLTNEVKGQNNMVISSSSDIEQMMSKFISISNSMENISLMVNELVKQSQNNKKELEDSVKLIKVVQAESGSLLEMNKVISKVATNTNLLAMNAAIEAAHAGTAGAGFSVVADEIRKLAETTATQAKNSSQSLQSIQDEIDNITESSVNVQKSFEDIINDIETISTTFADLSNDVKEQDRKANDVLVSLSNMKDSAEKASSNADTIIMSTKQSLESCANLQSKSHYVEDSIRNCAESIALLRDSGDQIVENSKKTKESVDDLSVMIGKFKVK